MARYYDDQDEDHQSCVETIFAIDRTGVPVTTSGFEVSGKPVLVPA